MFHHLSKKFSYVPRGFLMNTQGQLSTPQPPSRHVSAGTQELEALDPVESATWTARLKDQAVD